MKKSKINKIIIAAFAITISVFTSHAQKKVRSFTVTRKIPASVEKVWKVVGEDFGAIANSHPKIVSSHYNQGSITYGGEGAERVCNLNEDGTKFIKEKQINFDPANHTFTVQIFHIEDVPLDPEYTIAKYKVNKIDNNKSEIVFDMSFRTNPALLGAVAKGKFKKNIEDYLIAIEHHVTTGENVNKDNFKKIKKYYTK